jgi:hypothetical protein
MTVQDRHVCFLCFLPLVSKRGTLHLHLHWLWSWGCMIWRFEASEDGWGQARQAQMDAYLWR